MIVGDKLFGEGFEIIQRRFGLSGVEPGYSYAGVRQDIVAGCGVDILDQNAFL